MQAMVHEFANRFMNCIKITTYVFHELLHELVHAIPHEAVHNTLFILTHNIIEQFPSQIVCVKFCELGGNFFAKHHIQ